MGSRCSAVRRGKVDKNNQKEKVSTTKKCGAKSPLTQRSPSQQEDCAVIEYPTEEEALKRQEEESPFETRGCSEKNNSLPQEYTIAEVTPSSLETHPASASTEEKEANWVDENRPQLIQTVTSVMQVADRMLLKNMIQQEMYENINVAGTRMEKMRVLFKTLTCTEVKSAFFRILQEVEPTTCETEEVIKQVTKTYKEELKKKFGCELEGMGKDNDVKSLDKIYTELHIIQGESERVNIEHEIWEIQDKTRSETDEGTKINCNNIFKSTPRNSASSGQVRNIRTVMTKGIAGIGKTVSVKKFILDWVDGNANQDLDFIFVLPFRELNLVKSQYSLDALVKEFHPDLKSISVSRILANEQVLFIFDGLDESQLKLDFKNTERLTDATKESSVDIVVTNLIRKHLLPSALVWITSRPGAVQRIPRKYVHQWTEVRGFDEPQKIEYFRKRVENKEVCERIIKHILTSRSLYIMCHIPIFCWIAAKVLEHLLIKMDKTQDENIKIPTTLTEMYTHFFSIQLQIATEKYGNLNESDTEEIFESNQDFIFKLGRLAFEQLNVSNVIFTGKDIKNYGIDIDEVRVYCGLCTEIFKEESVFNTKKLYCFVHLTLQEYFAALFVYHSFARKKIDSPSLKDFLLKGSEEKLKSILDADPVDLPLDEFIEISIANSTQRKTGELDMFLRFLIGMSLESTQDLLQGLIQQTEDHKQVAEFIKRSLHEIDLLDCSPERCLNLVHCLFELKDSSLHDTVHQFLSTRPENQLLPVQYSALADSILMSSTPLDEFNLQEYRPQRKGIFRLIPAMRNCRKARISGVALDVWICEAISSALRMPNSVLTELHLINNHFFPKPTNILTDGLMKSQCKLEALSLAGNGIPGEKLASAIISIISNLRELELSGNILSDSLCSVLSVGLRQPKLKTLRLNRNNGTPKICEELKMAMTSHHCFLQELDLSYTFCNDSHMDLLYAGLTSKTCTLEVMSLSHNTLGKRSCEMLASVLGSETSNLRDLDLSYNDLHDSGVMALCNALKKPQCGLRSLRLSFCKVTVDGCASLASALMVDHCSLRELDLSFNHLTDQGVEMLMEIRKDDHCSLEELNVDHNEEWWFDLKLLRNYACDLTLDHNTAGVNVVLSKEKKTATYDQEEQQYPHHVERFEVSQVLCEEGLTGRHYWEVECNFADVGVAYKRIKRTGDCSEDFTLEGNEDSWCLLSDGHFSHNNINVEFVALPIKQSTIGVYLDWQAGVLSFFEIFKDTWTHLYTVRTTFTAPLHPGFSVLRGSIHLCKIK